MALFSVTHDIVSTSNGSILSSETLWVLYPDSVECTPEEVAFLGLSELAQLALAKPTQPTPADGKHWAERNCGGSTSLIYADVDNTAFTPDDNSGGGGGDGGFVPNYVSKGVYGGNFQS